MHHKIRIFSFVNIIAVLIPLFILISLLINPSFGNPLFMVAVFGQLFMFSIIILGIPIILFRKSFKSNVGLYFAFGILSLFSGIAGLVSEIVSGFDAATFYVPFIIALLTIGFFIILDTFKHFNKVRKQ